MNSVSYLRSLQLEKLSMDTGSVLTFDVLVSFKVLDVVPYSIDRGPSYVVYMTKCWIGQSKERTFDYGCQAYEQTSKVVHLWHAIKQRH